MATHTAFVDACRDHVGEALRSVTVYDDEDYETLYRRGDGAGPAGNRLAALVAAARDAHSPLRLLADEGALGGYQSSVHTFGDAVVLQFVVGRRRGYLACVDRAAGAEAVETLDALGDATEQ